MNREPARIRSPAHGFELRLHPLESHCEQYPGPLRSGAAVLLKLGTQGSNRTAPACQIPAVFNLDLNEAAQPLLGRLRFVQFLQQRPESRNAQVNNGSANLVLRPEVVVDVAQWDSCLSRDVGNRRLAESVAVGDLNGRLQEARPVVCFQLWHCSVNSQLTDSNCIKASCDASTLDAAACSSVLSQSVN